MSETSSDYIIRPYQPGDEEHICAVVRACYGDTYIAHKELYHPHQVARLNASQRLVSIVATTPAGEVIAHYAIERPDLGRIGETGEAMVHPDHRHHNIFEQMRPVLVDAAHRLNMVGLFGMPVTNHTFSQRMYEHFDGYPCGLSLGMVPKEFHNLAEPLTQRLSLLLYFQHLQKPDSVVLNVPRHHQEMVASTYAQFGITPVFPDPHPDEDATEEVDVQFFPEMKFGVIRVREAGPLSLNAIRRSQQSLIEGDGAEAVYLEVPLAQTTTSTLCEAAEGLGFFFAGIGPNFAPDGDVLRLQYLTAPLDTGLLKINHPFAQKLVAYIESEQQRVAKGE